MREIFGNLWDYLGQAALRITTAGQVSRRGMRHAARLHPPGPGLFSRPAEEAGRTDPGHGNHVFHLGGGSFNFPVENIPYEVPDFRLIERLCRELAALADRECWTRVVLSRPGCGGGGLEWRFVRPILERHLDERFLVIAPA